jgi:hypothetical protein
MPGACQVHCGFKLVCFVGKLLSAPIPKMVNLAVQWGRFINKKWGEKRQKNSENQVPLDSIFGASKKHYLSNFVLYML